MQVRLLFYSPLSLSTFFKYFSSFYISSGVSHKIDLQLKPAVDVLTLLREDPAELNSYDFAFIDADKSNYDQYVPSLPLPLPPPLSLPTSSSFSAFDDLLLIYTIITATTNTALRCCAWGASSPSTTPYGMVRSSSPPTSLRTMWQSARSTRRSMRIRG